MPRTEGANVSQLLVSICNVAARPRPSCLLRMDAFPHTIFSREAQWVDVGFGGELLVSGAGIAADEDFVYHVSIAQTDFETRLTVLDRSTFEVVHVQRLTDVVDAHSIARYGADLCVASTGTDEVVAYRIDGHRLTDPRVLFTPTGAKDDTHHINSVAVVNGELLCSAFGPKNGGSWSTAAHGYIRNVTRNMDILTGLQQPHTVTCRADEILFCNSQLGTVESVDGPVAYLAGYARGLAFAPDGTMYAATSEARRPTHLPARTDIFENRNDVGELHGRCAVVQFSSRGLRTEFGLSTFGAEIYDLHLLS